MSKYYLWLIPKGEGYSIFSKLINYFSKQYSLPKFDPHITLVSGIESDESEAISKTSSLVTFLSPFSVSLTNIECFDSSHKALIINAKNNTELATAHQKAREIFNTRQDQYLPHLSLAYRVYGNFSEDQKKKMIDQI